LRLIFGGKGREKESNALSKTGQKLSFFSKKTGRSIKKTAQKNPQHIE